MKSTQVKVVYTAVFGDYDYVQQINPKWDCDFICFTNSPQVVAPGWRIVMVSLSGESPAEANRRYKMFPHKYLASYEWSLYVDGNIKLLSDPSPLFEKYLEKGIIAIPKHQDRNCVYTEAKFCILDRRVNVEIVSQQMSRYADEGFPKEFGMTENGILFRRNHDKGVIDLMEAWWHEYCSGGRRDQLSLPYLIWKHQINILEIFEGPRISTKYFEINPHFTCKQKSFISRLADSFTRKKHLSFFYLVIANLINFVLTLRDLLRTLKK